MRLIAIDRIGSRRISGAPRFFVTLGCEPAAVKLVVVSGERRAVISSMR